MVYVDSCCQSDRESSLKAAAARLLPVLATIINLISVNAIKQHSQHFIFIKENIGMRLFSEVSLIQCNFIESIIW